MMTVMHDFPDNVLAISASGDVTSDDYRDVLVPVLEQRLGKHRRLRLLYVIGADFQGFTPGAAWEDAKVGMHHFAHFERVAVVSDVDWVRHAVRGFGFALPGEVRVYDLDGQDDAEAWLRAPAEPGELEFTLDEDRSLLILEPRDELEAADFDRVSAVLDPYLASQGSLSGLAIVARDFPGWDDFAALVAHLGFVREHHRQVERIAVVTNNRFFGALPRLASIFVHAEIRHFPTEEREAAESWAAGSA